MYSYLLYFLDSVAHVYIVSVYIKSRFFAKLIVFYLLTKFSIPFFWLCAFFVVLLRLKTHNYMEDFIHLHVHTHYSILDGQSKIPRIVDKAVADGMKGMAITDHGVMFGIKEFTDYCAKINKGRKKEGLEPFKPIIGCERYVARHSKFVKVAENGDKSGHHLIVLAKNYEGYKNLIKLVSRAWVDGYYYRPRTDREDLEK